VIGIDTNVLVRYFIEDDDVQTRKAQSFIGSLTIDSPGFVSVVAIVELVWVLERSRAASGAQIIEALRFLLSCDGFIIESEQEVFIAMVELSEGRASFPDALIAALGRSAGCSHTLTFDKRAARLQEFRLL
jgi:predicted nucleic-acid-binding protein